MGGKAVVKGGLFRNSTSQCLTYPPVSGEKGREEAVQLDEGVVDTLMQPVFRLVSHVSFSGLSLNGGS